MKKNLLFLPLVLAGLALSSCSKYDDSALSGRVTNVEGRVAKLEEQVKALNSDIVAIRTLVTALETKDYVTKVEPITEGSRSGYRISFTKSSPITIFHGTDGRDGASGANGRDGVSPVIAVRQEEGIYYWTLNGDWLKDEQGRKVKAQGTDGRNGQDGALGRDGVTPKLKAENDYWYVSYDNGLSWQPLNVRARGDQGAAGANAFQAVRVEDTQVIFSLADGTQVLTLPRLQEMALRFIITEDYAVFPKQTYEIPYVATGVTSETQIKVVGHDGVRVKLLRRDERNGVIEMAMPDSVVDTKVIVLISDGRGYTKMYALALYQGVLTTSSDNYLVESSRSELEVPIQTNSECTVEIPSEASSWISYEGLRALTMRNESLRFRVRENPLSLLRSAVVKLKVNGVVAKTIVIAQRGKGSTYALTPGTSLETLLDGNFTYELKLTSGTLSDADFAFLRKHSGIIRILDISELPMTELPGGAFDGSGFEEVKLPNGLTAIPNSCFSRSSIRRINIPQGVTRIGGHAFSWCSALTGALVIPQGVTGIGEQAFHGCSGLTGSLVIPQGVTSIGWLAFAGCTGFTGSLVIPQSVSGIGYSAFEGCTGFEGDLIIEGNTSIGPSAFWGSTRERLNFRAVYSKGTALNGSKSSAFWGGTAYGPKLPVLYVPVGARAQYEQKGWASQFERVEETNTWPQVSH